MESFFAIRIIGRLMRKVGIAQEIPLISIVSDHITELVDRTSFGTENGYVELVADKNGDVYEEFMYAKFEDMTTPIIEVLKLCFYEFGNIRIETREDGSKKIMTIIFEPTT